MPTIIYACDGVKDFRSVRFRLWDTYMDWMPQAGSTARTLLTPIRDQLALSALVAQGQVAGAAMLPLTEITDYSVYANQGQVNLRVADAWVTFHTVPIRKARKVQEHLDRLMPTIVRTPAPAVAVGIPDAGWMSDPDDSKMLRWWDGSQWGDFRKPA